MNDHIPTPNDRLDTGYLRRSAPPFDVVLRVDNPKPYGQSPQDAALLWTIMANVIGGFIGLYALVAR